MDDISITLDDIADDLEASTKAARLADAFFKGAGLPTIRTRGAAIAEEVAGEDGFGRRLVARCPADFRSRYRTLIHMEALMLADGDYGFLIAPACQILEEELRRSLADPAGPIVHDLLAALDAPRHRSQREVLEKWEQGGVPVTLGVITLVLYALRKGCEQNLPAAEAFLRERFNGRFVGLLRGRLDVCLEAIRSQFRNPAAHAKRTFDQAGYAAFTRLAVANDRFAGWDLHGPDPADPGPSAGVLHHHLANLLPQG